MSISVHQIINLYSTNGVWDEKSRTVATLAERSDTERSAHEYACLLVKSGMPAEKALKMAGSIFGVTLSTDYDVRKMEVLEMDTREVAQKLKKHPELERRMNSLFLNEVAREADLCKKAGLERVFFCPVSKLALVKEFGKKAGLEVEKADREGFYQFI